MVILMDLVGGDLTILKHDGVSSSMGFGYGK